MVASSTRFTPPPSLARELAALENGEYAARLALRPARVDDDCVAVELGFDPTIMNRGGRVHGGAIASLLLAAARVAAAASERPTTDRSVRLLTLNVEFLSSPHHGRLLAESHVVRRGREIAHTMVRCVDEGGTSVASAAAAIGLVRPDAVEEGGPAAELADRRPVDFAAGTRVPGSPYLSTAGMLVLPPENGSARALMPRERNRASDPSRIDEGAIAGLADSCAAYAAHMQEPRVGARGGVTVSMALVFHAARDEDLIGVGEVKGHAAGCYTAAVDVAGLASAIPVASALVVYRLPV